MSDKIAARDESLRLTRSRTIFHALVRLFGTGNLPSRLVLHVLGADHREGTTPGETRSVFAELFQLLGRDERVRELDLLLCGPNVAFRLHDTLHSFSWSHHTPAEHEQDQSSTSSSPPPAGTLTATLRYNSGLYHDVSELFPTPNAMFLFNAGLWGYDDWEPTLQRVFGCRGDDGDRPPVIITSYCPEEASHDMETIQRVVFEGEEGCKCLKGGGLEWLWKPEVNPHRSLEPRQTKCGVEGRILFENQSWQALRRSSDKIEVASPRVAAET